MVETIDGVLLFGGISKFGWNEVRNEILHMRAGANSWNILDITLKNNREAHVVIPLQ